MSEMNQAFKASGFITALIFFMGAVGIPHAVAQDDVNTAQESRLEEVVVTAERRVERQQDVPISMSVFNEDTIRKYFQDPTDVAKFAANYQITSTVGFNTTVLSVRGLGSTGQTNPLGNTSVLTYYDGIPAGSQFIQSIPQWDLERIEVDKGPQGTLFGRNAVGGAVQYTSAAPEDEFGGYGEMTLGRFDLRRFEGAVNIPVSDKIKARVSGLMHERGGDVFNTFRNVKTNKKGWWGVKGILDWEVTDKFDVRVIGRHFDLDSQDGVRFNSVPSDQFSEETQAFVNTIEVAPGVPVDQDISRESNFSKVQSRLADPFHKHNNTMIELDMNYDFGPMVLTAIGGYVNAEDAQIVQDIALPAPFADQYLPVSLEQWTGEVRLTSQTAHPLQWIVGGFYQHGEDTWADLGDFTTLLRDADGDGLTRHNGDSPEDMLDGRVPAFPGETVFFDAGNAQELDTWAIFAHTDFEWTDRLTTTHAVRFTREERDMGFRFTSFMEFPVRNSVTPGTLDQFEDWLRFAKLTPDQRRDQAVQIFSDPNQFDENGDLQLTRRSANADELTWRFAVKYQLTDDKMVYASAVKGWRGSIFSTLVGPAAAAAADPETSMVYEIGTKTQWFNNRLQVNLSGFFNNHEDFQDNLVSADLSGGAVSRIDNIPEVEIYGGELEIRALPMENMLMSLNLGTVQSEITEVTPGNEALLGNRLPVTEDWNFSGFVQYNYATPIGTFSPEFSWRYRGEYYTRKENDDFTGIRGGFWEADVRLGYEHTNGSFYGQFYMDNITNNVEPLLTRVDFVIFGADEVVVNPRRNWGIKVGYRF